MFPILHGMVSGGGAAGDYNAPITMYGLSGWSTANYYASAADGAPDAPATAGVLFTVDRALSTQGYIFNVMNASLSQGWSLAHDNSGRPEARMYDGGVPRVVLGIPFKADSNTVHAIALTYDGVDMKLYVNGAYLGSVGIAAYSTPAATVRNAIGKLYSNNFPAGAVTIVGAATSTILMSEAQILAWLDACAAAGDVVAFASGTDYLYSVKQSAQSAPTTWAAVTGSQDLTKAGTITPRTISSGSFAYNTDALLTTRLYNQIRIMPMGDSITVGVGSTNGTGYRDTLYDSLIADGDFTIDMIGPFSTGTGDDINHNAISGSPIAYHDSGGGGDVGARIGSGRLYHPQICILMLGANNTGSDIAAAAAPAALQNLVEYMFSLEPRMRYVLCHITTNSDAAIRARIATINAGITNTVIPALLAQDIPIVECAGTGDLDYTIHLSDSSHPNDAGYALLAAAIKPKLRAAAGWPEV